MASASGSEPLWLMPISAVTKTGWSGPTGRSPMYRKRFRSIADVLSQQSGRDLADRAVAAGGGRDDARASPHRVVSVRDRDRPTDDVETREVVDVIADVGHSAQIVTVLRAPARERCTLVRDSGQRRHLQLA